MQSHIAVHSVTCWRGFMKPFMGRQVLGIVLSFVHLTYYSIRHRRVHIHVFIDRLNVMLYIDVNSVIRIR